MVFSDVLRLYYDRKDIQVSQGFLMHSLNRTDISKREENHKRVRVTVVAYRRYNCAKRLQINWTQCETLFGSCTI